MYKKAFELSYKNKKVEIEIQDFVGDVRNINGTEDLFSLSYISDSKDKGQSILVTEADINFYADDYFNIDELKTVGETDIKVKYYEDDALLWSGFVIPDFFSTSVDNTPVVSMVATDRVGTLKEISNNAESNIPIQILASCLKQTGQDLPINLIADNNHFETPVQLERIEEIASYDVIRTFMVLFNCKITLYKNAWWIINKKLLESGFVNYKSYNSNGVGGSVTPFAQPILDIDLVDRDGQREIKPTASEISLFLEFGGSKKYPNNWNFEKWNGTTFDNWTNYNGFSQGKRQTEIIFYTRIDGYYQAYLSEIETENKSLWYVARWYSNKLSDNILDYPNLKSSSVNVPKERGFIDIALNGNFTTRDGMPIWIVPLIHNKTNGNYFTYNKEGVILKIGSGTPNLNQSNFDYVHNPRASSQNGFNPDDMTHASVDVNWDIKNTFDLRDFGSDSDEIEMQVVFLGGIYSQGSLDYGTDVFLNAVNISFNDSQVTGKGLIFKTKQGGEKFSKSREPETILFSDKINQGVNGYFYNYKYDDTSIVDLPSEFALSSVRERADMFSKARDYYSLDGNFIVNPLAKYTCGLKSFVLVGGENRREDASIIVEEIVSNTLNRTDFIYTYFDDGKDKVKTIGTASGGSSSGGGGSSPSTPQLIKEDEEGNYYSEQPFYSLGGLSAFGFSEVGGGTGEGGIINVIDNLTSTSKTDPLSANQGRYLKTLIDNIEVGEGGQVIVDWEAITGKPTTFTPSTHTHIIGDVTGLQGELDGKASLSQLDDKEDKFTKNTAFNKNFGTGLNDVARGNHTHAFASLTSIPTTLAGYGITDGANKVHTHSISDVTNLQTELNKKATNTALTTHVNNKSNPHDVTTAQIGAVDLTSNQTIGGVKSFTSVLKVSKVVYEDFLVFERGANLWSFGMPGNNLVISNGDITNPENRLITIGLNNNIRIGSYTPSPSEKLDVIGNIKATGTLTALGGNSSNWNKVYGDFNEMFRKVGTSIEAKLPLYSLGGLSAYGFSEEGSETGGGIVNILPSWANYTSDKSGWALSAGLGKDLKDNKADKTDPRFTDARTPLAHTHIISDVTGLQTALNAKTNQTFSDGLNTRLTSIEGGSATTVNVSGTGDLLASVSKVGNNINFIKGNQSWDNLTGKPTTFAPSAHTHIIGDVTGLQGELDGKASLSQLDDKEDKFTKNTAFNKNFGTGLNDVARGNHTHAFASLTSIPTTLAGYGITDGANKVHTHAISDVTNLQTELNKKATNTALTDHVNKTDNPHSVTKSQVGLGNVANKDLSNVDNIQQATKTEFTSHKNLFDSMFRKVGTSIEAKLSLYSLGGLSAYGFSEEGSETGGGIVNILPSWANYTTDKSGWALSAGLGVDLNTRKADKTWVESLLEDYVPTDTKYTAGRGLTLTGTVFSTSFDIANYATVTALGGKVDKITGKSLISDGEITRLAGVTNQTRASLNITNVDNTSDANKPISNATQTALNSKLATSIFNTHNNDNIRHVTGTERTKWNGVVTDFAGLEIGGRNLLTESVFLTSGTKVTKNGLSGIYIQNGVGKIFNSLTFEPNTQYSFYVDKEPYPAQANDLVIQCWYTDGTYQSIINYSNTRIQNSFVSAKGKTIESIRKTYHSGGSIFYAFQITKMNISLTDYSPAPEDQVSDWLTTDVNSFSFIKNKPTLLSQFTDNIGVASHIANKANPHGVTTAQIGAVDLTSNQTIGGVKSFTSVLKVSKVVYEDFLVFERGANLWSFGMPGNNLVISNGDITNQENRLITIGLNNNIRIGSYTPSPSEKLDVIGNIKASGTLTALGGNSTNWNKVYGDFNEMFRKVGTSIEAKLPLYSLGGLSAYGFSDEGSSSGGGIVNILPSWESYDTSKSGWALSAGLGENLRTRVVALENAEIDLSGYATLNYVNDKVKTNVPLNAKFTDTIVDISGKVDKKSGFSLVADTEITRLSSVTNQDLSSYAKTSDVNTLLLNKVDKVTGKSLISDTEITRLSSVTNQDLTPYALKTYVDTEVGKKWTYNETTIKAVKVSNAVRADNVGGFTVGINVPANAKFTDTIVDISGKVDKVAGKGLSTNDFTTVEKNKLAILENQTRESLGVDNVTNESKATMFTNPTFTGTTKVTILELNSNWKFVKVGDNIELQFDGVTKQIMTNNGDIIATAGVTAYQ